MNLHKAHYAKQVLDQLDGVENVFTAPFFNEFVIKLPIAVADVNRSLLQKGIIGGYDLGLAYPELANHMLIAVTELRTKAEIDQLAKELEAILHA